MAARKMLHRPLARPAWNSGYRPSFLYAAGFLPMYAKYSVHTPFVGIENFDGKASLLSIPVGSLLTVTGAIDSVGMIEIELDGSKMRCFLLDIEQRATRLDSV